LQSPASTKFFGGVGPFYFTLAAEKFQKVSKMKLLSSFQLATLLAYFSIAMVQATFIGFLYLLRDDMNWAYG